MKLFPRLLLVFAALILAGGALLHASAFNKVTAALAASNLVPFAAGSLKGLWLADSATCLLLAIIFATVAVRPAAAGRFVIFLLALIPAATAVFIYTFLGSFIGGHVLLTASVAAGAAALFKR
jgi:hypothetical protein